MPRKIYRKNLESFRVLICQAFFISIFTQLWTYICEALENTFWKFAKTTLILVILLFAKKQNCAKSWHIDISYLLFKTLIKNGSVLKWRQEICLVNYCWGFENDSLDCTLIIPQSKNRSLLMSCVNLQVRWKKYYGIGSEGRGGRLTINMSSK